MDPDRRRHRAEVGWLFEGIGNIFIVLRGQTNVALLEQRGGRIGAGSLADGGLRQKEQARGAFDAANSRRGTTGFAQNKLHESFNIAKARLSS